MKRWIQFPRSAGDHSKQAHCDLPPLGPYEREFGKEGFFGPTTHIHHAHAPTGWVKWEGPLRPRAYDLAKHSARTNSPWDALPIMHNAAIDFRWWRTSGKMDHLISNADGDELLFVHAGSGHLFCDFGHLPFREGDYIMLPRSTCWRVECDGECDFLLIQATNDSYRLPDKGLVGPHAIFDASILDVPQINDAFKAQQTESEWSIIIKRQNALSTVTYPFNPLDAIGWHGDNLPVRVNWRDIRPLMSHRYHVPPSAHTTFLCNRFVVCTFVPRPIESDPGALKVPFYHSNNDYDEIIFYHAGNFFSRDNIHPGMLSWHPCGFAHGPHPKAYEAGKHHTKKETDEVAVMIDTRDMVNATDAVGALEWNGYADSWKVKPE